MRVEGYYSGDHRRFYFTCCRHRMHIDAEIIARLGWDWADRKIARFGRYARGFVRRQIGAAK